MSTENFAFLGTDEEACMWGIREHVLVSALLHTDKRNRNPAGGGREANDELTEWLLAFCAHISDLTILNLSRLTVSLASR